MLPALYRRSQGVRNTALRLCGSVGGSVRGLQPVGRRADGATSLRARHGRCGRHLPNAFTLLHSPSAARAVHMGGKLSSSSKPKRRAGDESLAYLNPHGQTPSEESWVRVESWEEAKGQETTALRGLPEVVIAEAGQPAFKFVYIEVLPHDDDGAHVDTSKGRRTHCAIVRGWPESYHKYVVKKFKPSLDDKGLRGIPIGGGRIIHTKADVRVFGFSYGYGSCDVAEVAGALKRAFPAKNVLYSTEGY